MMNYGLIGANVKDSLSKLIHESYSKINYELVSLKSERDVLNCLNSNFKGLNVTIPYKNFVYAHCDYLSDLAKRTQCVNTVIKKDGKTYGYNTDIFGFEKLIQKNNIEIKGKNCLVLGTGSTSRTVTLVLNELGAKSIKYLSRNPVIKDAYSYSDIDNYKNSQIIINTTPVGMNSDEESLLDFSIFKEPGYFIDVIYNKAHTKTAINALENGFKTFNGLYMLIAQAQKAQELFFETNIEERIIDKAYLKLFFKCFNLAFIGHPLSGKSYVAKSLSPLLAVPCIDIDEEIEKRENKKISEIFTNNGEDYFRSIESSLIKEVSNQKGNLISLGGGAVLNKENMQNILKYSLIVSLKRDIKTINDNEFVNRPLCNCREQLMALITNRQDLYKKYSDIEIVNDGSFESIFKKIGEIL